MQLIEKQREDGDGRKLHCRTTVLWEACRSEQRKGYVSFDTGAIVRLAELLHEKGLLTDEEVLQVFDLECDWEVAK